MKVVATVEARMGSSRLPGKTMKRILGKPTLELLLERLARSRRVDEIVVATTTGPEDDVIQDLCRGMGLACYRGSAADVLDRVEKAAASAGADLIAQITGDCVLTCPEVLDTAVDTFIGGGYDYLSNLMVQTYPQGVDARVFRHADLKEINDRLAGDDADAREHVYLYFEEHPERYRIHNLEAPPEYRRPDWRLDLDYQEDLDLLTVIFEALYPTKPDFSLAQLVAFLDKHPELQEINRDMYRKPLRANV